ncbi:hypothetical protein HIM_00736 [Hirsutella minnesotensis 3608]|nr:hypothetical protein HIM_00736 [Hirsutella minnesotensis 3608]
MGRFSLLGLGRRGKASKLPSGSPNSSSEDPILANKRFAKEIVNKIHHTHALLCKEADLRPGATVNKLLTELVRTCTKVHDSNVTQEACKTKILGSMVLSSTKLQKILPSLRSMCASAECFLEAHWAEKIVAGGNPEKVLDLLKSFPYYGNYEKLAHLELCSICSLVPFPKKMAFIGSGPLPLTSLCLLDMLKSGMKGVGPGTSATVGDTQEAPQNKVSILNVDHDSAAIGVSQEICRKMGKHGEGMKFQRGEAGSDNVDLSGCDVVYFAALVGTTQAEKEELLIKVVRKMKPGALIVVRSSWGLRTCLYSEFDMASKALLRHLDISLVIHPYGEIVNSIIIAKVKPQPEEK